MAKSEAGRTTVEFLVQRGRLEIIAGRDLTLATDALLGRAQRRLSTARAGLAGDDGSHMAVEDSMSAQFAGLVSQFAKPTFERLRRGRRAAQYFDPDAPGSLPMTRPGRFRLPQRRLAQWWR